MVIRASTGKTVDRLLADLSHSDAVRRDAAVARLIVIGERALHRLVLLVATGDIAPEARAAAFRALEGIADPKALDVAVDAIVGGEPVVAAAALGVARAMLDTSKGIEVLDRLAGLALSGDQTIPVRIAAVRALSDLDASAARPVLAELPAAILSQLGNAATPAPADARDESPRRILDEASRAHLPDRAETLKRALVECGNELDPGALFAIVEHVRMKEGTESGDMRNAWQAARAAAHAVLGQKGSRLALFDIRETLERAREPLAVEFLSALIEVGDASCLEAMAMADAGAAGAGLPPDDWWRRQLADVFRAIAQREGITRRHAVARRIEKRWPGRFGTILAAR